MWHLETALREFRRAELALRTRPTRSRIAGDVALRSAFALGSLVVMMKGNLPAAVLASGIGGATAISLIGSWFHEALHGNVLRSSRARYVVRLLCSAPLAVSQLWWTEKHLRGHHPNPQDPDRDPDIQFGPLARVSAGQRWRITHRFQRYSFWMLAPLATLAMALPGEFARARTKRKRTSNGLAVQYVLEKYGPSIVYWCAVFASRPIRESLLVLAIFFLVSGWLASAITQSQHTVVSRNLPDDVELPPLANQFLRSADLTHSTRFWWWVSGGTSHHVTHHVVPQLTFLELPAATGRLSAALAGHEFDIAVYPSFRSALRSHLGVLRLLSSPPASPSFERS